MNIDTITQSDALAYARTLPDESVNCIVTSPPYYRLRDYGVAGQIGREDTPLEFVGRLVELFRECRRVLRGDGTCWINIGDTYNDSKSLMMLPARLAIALCDDGWILRSDIIWHKPNPMPESVIDRPTKSHEYIFMFAKAPRYWYDAEAIAKKRHTNKFNGSSTFKSGANGDRNDGGRTNVGLLSQTRNIRSVWTVPSQGTPRAHFATFPQRLIEPMVLAGCPAGGIVFDPFMGSGTTALVARRLGRHYLGSELNPEYVALAETRLRESDPFQAHEVEAGIVQRSLFG